MRCPKHPEIWLYENMMETEGYCPECGKWYKLKLQTIEQEVIDIRLFLNELKKRRLRKDR